MTDETAHAQGLRTLNEARLYCVESLFALERSATGDVRMAPLASELEESSAIPTMHASLLTYHRELAPHVRKSFSEVYTGDELERPLTVVKIPTGAELDGERPTKEESVASFKDVGRWSMRTVEVPNGEFGRTDQVRIYLPPASMLDLFEVFARLQEELGLLRKAEHGLPVDHYDATSDAPEQQVPRQKKRDIIDPEGKR